MNGGIQQEFVDGQARMRFQVASGSPQPHDDRLAEITFQQRGGGQADCRSRRTRPAGNQTLRPVRGRRRMTRLDQPGSRAQRRTQACAGGLAVAEIGGEAGELHIDAC